MDMTGEQRILADRETVWRALNDPRILEACIPGCQELVKSSDTEMRATATMKVGPVTARFQGAVTLSDLDPPKGYRITGEGQGGIAGFARGTAVVRLEEDGDATILHYEVSAQVGGKLAQLGGRLIEATARHMSGAFFKTFAAEIQALQSPEAAQPAPSGDPATAQMAQERLAQAPRGHARPAAAAASDDRAPGLSRYAGFAGTVLLPLMLAGLWLLLGGTVPSPSAAGASAATVSPDFSSAVLLGLVALIGYLFGRAQGDSRDRRVVILDSRLAEALDLLHSQRDRADR